MTLNAEGGDGPVFLGGAVLGDGMPRLVRLDGFGMDFVTRGRVLLIRHGVRAQVEALDGVIGTVVVDVGEPTQ